MGNRNACLKLTVAILALAASSQRSSAQDTTEICLWDAKSGELIRVMSQDGTATSVAFSPDGSTLASGSGSGGFETGFLNIWDVKIGKLVRKAELDGAINALQFFPGGKTLAVGTLKGTLLVSSQTGKPIAKLGDGYTTFLDVSDDGQIVVSNAGGKVAVWDVATRKAVAEVKPKDYAYGVSISPDSKRFAFGSRAGGVGIVESATGRIEHTFETPKLVQTVAFSPDGKQLAAGNYFTGELYIWDMSTREKITDVKLSNQGIFSLAWSLQGAFLAASVYHDRIIILLDPKTGKHLETIITAILGARSVTVSPDGSLIAAACTPTVMR
ncbi:MAG: PD40 domain-containing protein [Planctomycetes bacterium]|nr:PD40 domain-containing protein [Planctomycetota bacterium]